MRYLYNVTDYNELDEWHSSKRKAVAAAKEWFDGTGTIYVTRHAIEPLTPNYACKLLKGCGWSLEQVTIMKLDGEEKCPAILA